MARRLIGLRMARSLGQGALVVDLALYLKALGWSGLAIGGTLAGTGLIAATLSMVVGIASDRSQRRGFLVTAEVLTIACACAALATSNPWVLVPAIMFAGFGRGANGAASFFGPAEQAWMAIVVQPVERGYVYSLNLAAGSVGMAVGAALAVLPEVLTPA
ncbi:MAG: MFS transporter, partial [Gammaproteobacteria bacterium]